MASPCGECLARTVPTGGGARGVGAGRLDPGGLGDWGSGCQSPGTWPVATGS